ncbi:MAG TPA: XdhC/CoxI family protein, partial [Thermoanaerobaculia bacterium]|nr:XdhC/CoxI family protein [Thermoanaerobaculia bacterium]
QPGAKLAVSSAGRMAGSVSGGCVEGAVVEAAKEVLASGQPRLLSFGVADETAWSVGLSCGGEIEIWVEPVAADDASATLFKATARALRARQLAARLTLLSGPKAGASMLIGAQGGGTGSLGSAELDRLARAAAEPSLEAQRPARLPLPAAGEGGELFVDVYPPPRKLVVVGAVHIALPLVSLARTLGFETVVIDPRGPFATRERFAQVDRLICAWPQEALEEVPLDEGTALVVLSHDPKLDLPALERGLASRARYLGALGSKKTHAKRLAALAELGYSADQIARIHAPIGLDLGGRSPEEIALAILAEMVAVANGSSLGRKEP